MLSTNQPTIVNNSASNVRAFGSHKQPLLQFVCGYLVSEPLEPVWHAAAVLSSDVLTCIALGSEFKDELDETDVADIAGKIDDSWTRESDATSKSSECNKVPVVSGTLAVWTELPDCSTVVLSSVDEEPGSTGVFAVGVYSEPGSTEVSAVGVYSGGGSSTTHSCWL